jgi:hypothetical protein
MAGLEGTVKTPLGTVQKKTALYIGGGVVILGGIVWYRHKQTASTTVDSTATTDAEIDPATGYAYGSPEDAAALAQQATYVTPTDPTGGGSSSIPTGGTGYASNGAWVQGVENYLTSSGLVQDPTALSSALGKYITGSYVAGGSSDESLINQAIAAQGYPPVSGSSGYPPAINRNPPNGAATSGTVGPITGRSTNWGQESTGVRQTWKAAHNAVKYQIKVDGKLVTEVTGLVYEVSGLKPNSHHTIIITPVGADGKLGPSSTSTGYTKK